MTSMVQQVPNSNQGDWEGIESYARSLVNNGQEVYISSGVWGQGNRGHNGFASTVDQGWGVVPGMTWKVVLVLPKGDNDLSRVNTSTKGPI